MLKKIGNRSNQTINIRKGRTFTAERQITDEVFDIAFYNEMFRGYAIIDGEMRYVVRDDSTGEWWTSRNETKGQLSLHAQMFSAL